MTGDPQAAHHLDRGTGDDEEPEANMTPDIVDVIRLDHEDVGTGDPVATLVDGELRDGATADFIDLWRRRPRALPFHYADSTDQGCVLYIRDVTLEDEPVFYLTSLGPSRAPVSPARTSKSRRSR